MLHYLEASAENTLHGGQCYPLKEGEVCLIGRDRSSTILFPPQQPSISAKHATVTLENVDGEYKIFVTRLCSIDAALTLDKNHLVKGEKVAVDKDAVMVVGTKFEYRLRSMAMSNCAVITDDLSIDMDLMADLTDNMGFEFDEKIGNMTKIVVCDEKVNVKMIVGALALCIPIVTVKFLADLSLWWNNPKNNDCPLKQGIARAGYVPKIIEIDCGAEVLAQPKMEKKSVFRGKTFHVFSLGEKGVINAVKWAGGAIKFSRTAEVTTERNHFFLQSKTPDNPSVYKQCANILKEENRRFISEIDIGKCFLVDGHVLSDEGGDMDDFMEIDPVTKDATDRVPVKRAQIEDTVPMNTFKRPKLQETHQKGTVSTTINTMAQRIHVQGDVSCVEESMPNESMEINNFALSGRSVTRLVGDELPIKEEPVSFLNEPPKQQDGEADVTNFIEQKPVIPKVIYDNVKFVPNLMVEFSRPESPSAPDNTTTGVNVKTFKKVWPVGYNPDKLPNIIGGSDFVPHTVFSLGS